MHRLSFLAASTEAPTLLTVFAEYADHLMLAQVAVFILGSIETSSTTLSYCLHELAHHPELQVSISTFMDMSFQINIPPTAQNNNF